MSNNKKTGKVIGWGIFLVYIVVIIYFVLFAEMWGRSDISQQYSYNIIPFKEIKRFALNIDKLGWQVVLVNLLGNVVAFIPFGMCLPGLSDDGLTFFSASILTFDFSLAIELMQLVTRVGCFDVDDLILNTAGGMIGYAVYSLYRRMKGKKNDIL